MSQHSTTELALLEALSYTPPTTTLSPGPGPSSSGAKPAAKRCCAAWHRAYKACMDQDKSNGGDLDLAFAANNAGKAYCEAMPLLAGYAGVRDFIACAAHGILIGAIPPEKSGQLLYAAQVALNTFLHQPKSSQGAVSRPRPPSKNPALGA